MHTRFEYTTAAVAVLAVILSMPAGRAQTTFAAGAIGTTPVGYQWSTDYATDAPDDVNYFYSDLSPYGQWVDLEGYGWCWQPTVVAGDPQWQPYCDGGHWVYTDSGWFWKSDYDWGWAPFHYGRWLRHERCGWVWFPDRVWGPAWVTWRTAGNNCGWAPLPLHATFDERGGLLFNGVQVGANFDFGLPADRFTFVALGDFCAPDLGHRRLAASEVAQIYGRAAVANNFRYANHAFYNGGIPVERVAAVTHADLRPIAIRDEPAGGVREAGAGTVVYRRIPQRADNSVRVVAQKVDDRHPVIQHAALSPANEEHRMAAPDAPVRTADPPTGTELAPPQRTSGPAPDAGKPVEIIGPEPEPDQAVQPPGSLMKHTPRSQRVADEAHALPPLFRPHDEPTPLPATKPMAHVPRSQQVANEAHALKPLVEKPPPTELAKPGNPHPDAVTSPKDQGREQP